MFGIRLCQKTSTPCEPKRTPSGLETDVLTGGFATLLLSGSLETDVLTGGFATLLFFVFFCPGSAVPSLTGGFATLLLSVRLETDVLTGGFATLLLAVSASLHPTKH